MDNNIKKLQTTIKGLKQELAELKASKQQLESIIDMLPGHVYWLDKNNVFLGCNLQQAKDVDLSCAEDLVGKTIADFQSKENTISHLKVNNEVMATAKTKIIEEKSYLPNGKIEGVYLSQKSPLRDQENNIIGTVGISFDITKRKQLEQELKEAKQRADKAEQEKLKYLAKMNRLITGQESDADKSVEEHTQEMVDYLNNIISLIPAHVYWKDRNGVYLGCNDRQAKSLGFTSGKEIVGKTDYVLPWKTEADILRAIDQKVMRTKRAYVVEEPSTLPNQGVATFLSHKVPLHNKDGKIIGILGVSINITERKKLEEKLKAAKEKAEAANLAKTEFMANMSHDIRTPISGIMGMTQVLKSKINNKIELEFVQNIAKSANQLLGILNEVIEFSKLETKHNPVRQNHFDLKELITEVMETFATDIKEKKLTSQINYVDTIPKWFIGDKVRINRILLNLISNAIKFTKRGGISVDVSTKKKNRDKIMVKLVVQDTGIGIPETQIPFIFEKFSRLSSAYKGLYKGTGLGLAIVKRFITDMHGIIDVASKENQGSTFTCFIPLCLSKKDLIQQQAEDLAQPKHNVKLNILLIEDDKVCQLSQQLLLANMGHNVDIVDTGMAAIKKVNNKLYDLILTDIGLPDIDGCQLAEKIRQIKNNQNTPIIALTAHVSDEHKKSCADSGINMVLHKPMNLKEIQKVIRQIIIIG